jgi:hypothetical protein
MSTSHSYGRHIPTLQVVNEVFVFVYDRNGIQVEVVLLTKKTMYIYDLVTSDLNCYRY